MTGSAEASIAHRQTPAADTATSSALACPIQVVSYPATAGRKSPHPPVPEGGRTLSEQVVFLHGAGKAGVAAWPRQAVVADPAWIFLDRPAVSDDPDTDCQRVLDRLRSHGPGHVVGHSFGGIAVLLAAQQEPDLVRSVTLLEPACFDLARGRDAVEQHIAVMQPVFAVSNDPSVPTRDFSSRFAAAMGSAPPDLPDELLEANVARLRAMKPPWGSALNPDVPLPVPTLVLTGDWNPLYEETALALTDLGAAHEHLVGFGHRVQDQPGALDRMIRHWDSSTALTRPCAKPGA
ncbi:alpha/beta hydrolase [Nakamurella sp. A5-74]|uniref:Alpha/beta hydrolase n=1 Tax=Nakamurella sp. A5-74 TaxID=3158264 RepID=A0AAU8DQ40_9ACTN